MIVEQVILSVSEQNGDAFRAAVQGARKFLESAAPLEFRRSVEDPGRHMFLVRWNSLQAHKDYAATPELQKFTGAFRQHIEKSHGMVHYAPTTGAVDRPMQAHVLETVTLAVNDPDGFEKALPEIMKHRLGVEGQFACEFRRCVEAPERFALFAYWACVEAHTMAFRSSPEYPLFTGAIRPFLIPPVAVEHWTIV